MDPMDKAPSAEAPAAVSGTGPEVDNRYIHRVAILAFLLNLGPASAGPSATQACEDRFTASAWTRLQPS